MIPNNISLPFDAGSNTEQLNSQSYLRMNDIRINDISIISNGAIIGIINQYAVCEISENLFHNNVTGVLGGIDGVNILSNLPVTGQEFLLISFTTPGSDKEQEALFSIDKIIDRGPLQNKQSQFFDIHFVCPTFLINLFSNVNRSYKTTINKMVSDIFETNFTNTEKTMSMRGDGDTGKQLISNEGTEGESTIIIPNWNPFTAINWLSKRASSSSNPLVCDYVFYQDLDGFHFRSISSMFDGDAVDLYVYGVDNANDFIRDNPDSPINVGKSMSNIKRLVISGFDRSKETIRGAYSSSLLIHDIVNNKYETLYYNYLEDYDQKPSLNNGPILPKNINMYAGHPESKSYFVPTHINMYGDPSFSEFNGANDGVKLWLQRHDAQLEQFKSSSIEIDVAGNSLRRIGDKVYVHIPSFEVSRREGEAKLDETLSGNYIITRVKHTLTKQRGHSMRLKLCKESNMVASPDSTVLDNGMGSASGLIDNSIGGMFS